MTDNPVRVLQTSEDSKELMKAAVALARSKEPADHDTLLKHLRTQSFLSRLDTKEDYAAAAAKRLRISRVLEALGKNDAPSARQTIVALTQERTFLEEEERVVALIEASTEVRPPPPALVRFWDAHSQPEDGFTPVTITALVNNGTAPALDLLERKMADPKHEDDVKIAWMRSRILTHRNDLLLLQSCERMLTGVLPSHLRPALVEVLFDYRPGEWYRPANASRPPDRRQASAAALAQLRRLGYLALQTVQLTESQKEAVTKTLEEIEKFNK
jgi:hypothetical protein